jgi:hypothetical protein
MRPLVLGVALALGVCALAVVGAQATHETDDFGAPITLEQATPLARVLANPERYALQPVLVRGRLTDVCQRKGCWTVLQDQAAQVRVRFKDYGFFLPKDSTGRQAFVEGVVVVETLTEEQARHYESEARDGDPDSVRGPRRELGFTASGVRLLPRSPPPE